ncbi:Ubiquitin carboxyl-terminal hydrolase [Plasmodium coatneyi]|uniref:Ubiquitin carboxyl-terminal hydrolase n=1 Tax=Plasmodium coatneyi TaxID=208452 RepID=A0A1B1DSG6_9APIC|nr:Ubiquitin carboxyl-terminal hydrolase [Plasmodium coatneyi]ANQ05728.1 Ubiquitin carboxyl-terminal hydrolase [Plasmodium coatneyi]
MSEKACLGTRNSWKIYYEDFDGKTKQGSCDGECNYMKMNLESILNECNSADQAAQKIAKGWCAMNNKCGRQKPAMVDCFSFYYWLGEVLSGCIEGEADFNDAMGNICTLMEYREKGKGYPCTCPSVAKGQFQELKLLYDYFKNYTLVTSKIQGRSSSLSGACVKYRQELLSTYVRATTTCAGKKDTGEYCEELYGIVHTGRGVRNPTRAKQLLESLKGSVSTKIHQQKQELVQSDGTHTSAKQPVSLKTEGAQNPGKNVDDGTRELAEGVSGPKGEKGDPGIGAKNPRKGETVEAHDHQEDASRKNSGDSGEVAKVGNTQESVLPGTTPKKANDQRNGKTEKAAESSDQSPAPGYSSIFSRKHNPSLKRERRRKRSPVEQNLDMETDDDDSMEYSSTEYSTTEHSTEGGSTLDDSTFDSTEEYTAEDSVENSNTLYSAPYTTTTRQSTAGKRINTTGGHHRRNIRYHPA